MRQDMRQHMLFSMQKPPAETKYQCFKHVAGGHCKSFITQSQPAMTKFQWIQKEAGGQV